MKIHIVQKGDTLWEIAKNYEVDFEELKELNSHISSPDMIMPGMKIRIPSSHKVVKKKNHSKEMQKTKKEKKDSTPSLKPMEQVIEDDKEKPKEMKVKMPQMSFLGMEMKDEKSKEPYVPPKKMKEMPKIKPMMDQQMDYGQQQSMPPIGCQPMPVIPVHYHGACHCCGAHPKHHQRSAMFQMKGPTSPNHMMMHQPMVDYKQNNSNQMSMTPPVGNMQQCNTPHRDTNKYQESQVHTTSNYQYNDFHQSTPNPPTFPTFDNYKGNDK